MTTCDNPFVRVSQMHETIFVSARDGPGYGEGPKGPMAPAPMTDGLNNGDH